MLRKDSRTGTSLFVRRLSRRPKNGRLARVPPEGHRDGVRIPSVPDGMPTALALAGVANALTKGVVLAVKKTL